MVHSEPDNSVNPALQSLKMSPLVKGDTSESVQ